MHSSARSDADQNRPALDAAGVVRRALLSSVVLTATVLVLGGIGRLVVFDAAIGEAEADVVGWVAAHRSGVLDTAATVGSSLTDTRTVIGILVGAVTVLVAAGHRRLAGVMLIGFGLEVTAFFAVGAIIDRSRPTAEALDSVPSTPSFPSGHVAAAVVLYGSLAFSAHRISRPGRVPGRLWIVPAVFGLAVASSRVYEAVHFPTDVTAGFIVGAGALYGAAYTMQVTGELIGGDRSTDPDAAPDVGERADAPATPARALGLGRR